MFSQEMQKRTRTFSLRILRLCFSLPRNMEPMVLGKQLLRCATSVGANYRAACHAKSRADFLSKIKTCEEEADECEYWLDLLIDAGIIHGDAVADIRREAHEIASILASAAKNTKNN